MSDLQYPLINGVRYSWASVKVNIGPVQFLGCKSINFNEKLDPTKIHGTSQNILGATAGQYDADGDAEFYQQEADVIVAALGVGWGNRPLTITVQYQDDGQPTVTKTIITRFTARTQGGSEGAEALTSKFTMFILAPIDDNGITMIPLVQASSIV